MTVSAHSQKKQTCEWSCQQFCPNLNGSRTFSPTAIPLKLGLIQTLSRLCSLRPDFGRNADWLLEQCHKIWLAVGNAESWKALFLAWLFSWIIRRQRRERPILLLCTIKIQKIHMAVHNFSGFALFMELMWVYRGVESLWKLLTANKVLILIYQQTSADQNPVHLKSGFIWKFSR